MSRISHSFRPVHPLLGLIAAFMLPGFALVGGCGGSESGETVIVDPPGPSETTGSTENESTESEPPGGLELPPGEIPAADSGESGATGEGGGLQMPDQPVPVESGADAGAASDVQFATWQEIEQTVTSTGQITVVDLWSLSCEPCLKEFPGLVRLHEEFGDSVRCVSVDIDFDGRKSRPPEYYQQRVADFVKGVGADFTTFISKTPSDEVYAATQLDSIPAVLIYDADGKIVRVFVDAGETIGFSYDKDIIPLVTKLAG